MIYTNDTGTRLQFDIGETVESVIEAKIIYVKPTGDIGEWVGTMIDSQTVSYYLQEGDLDKSGTWKMQVHITTPVWSGYGEQTKLDVRPSLDYVP